MTRLVAIDDAPSIPDPAALTPLLVERPPLFILGSPRSGTTMLAGLLRDTAWGEPFETHFIPKYYRMLFRFSPLSDRGVFCALVAEILSERPIAQRRLGLNPDRLFDSLPRHDFAHIVHAIGMAYAAQRRKPSWGDKTPHYVTQVGMLSRLFPTSKMIYLVRDGRDVALSLMRKSWGPATVYACARQWRDENQPQAAIAVLRAKGLLHEIRYEDLLAAPAAQLASVMRFLGEDAESGRAAEHAAGVAVANAGKWRREMTGAQVRIFEAVAGDTLQRFGYPIQHRPRDIGAMEALGYRAQDSFKRWRNLVQMNVFDTVKIRYGGKEPFAE